MAQLVDAGAGDPVEPLSVHAEALEPGRGQRRRDGLRRMVLLPVHRLRSLPAAVRQPRERRDGGLRAAARGDLSGRAALPRDDAVVGRDGRVGREEAAVGAERVEVE
jgi:hypothetical protein